MYVIITVVILLLVYLYGTRNFNYFTTKGIIHEKPVPFFGTTVRTMLCRTNMTNYLIEIYKKYPNEKMVGIYAGNDRVLVLRDPELVKQVMVKSFYNFHERKMNPNKKYEEAIMRNIFMGDGDTWKILRENLSPAFSHGKVKRMFPLIVKMTERLQNTAKVTAETGKEVNIRDLIARYVTDFIVACGFGVDVDSLNDEQSAVRKLGRRIFETPLRDIIIGNLKSFFPYLMQHVNFVAKEIEEQTVSIVKQATKQRNHKPSGRNDFIDLLLELKEKGNIVGESIEKRKPDGTQKITELFMDDSLMAAQVFLFFAAGYETSSSSSSFTLHQLAFHPEYQKKCQEEIDEVLRQHGGKLSYDAVNELKYVQMCFRESMRIFPPLGWLARVCARPYTFPDSSITIDKGVYIYIPVQAMHMDERFFEDPEEFRPERFHPDNINETTKSGAYLPFGQGPRGCIGERLGLMQSIAGLAAILSQFSVEPSKHTLRHPIADPTAPFVQTIAAGLPLALVKRK